MLLVSLSIRLFAWLTLLISFTFKLSCTLYTVHILMLDASVIGFFFIFYVNEMSSFFFIVVSFMFNISYNFFLKILLFKTTYWLQIANRWLQKLLFFWADWKPFFIATQSHSENIFSISNNFYRNISQRQGATNNQSEPFIIILIIFSNTFFLLILSIDKSKLRRQINETETFSIFRQKISKPNKNRKNENETMPVFWTNFVMTF